MERNRIITHKNRGMTLVNNPNIRQIISHKSIRHKLRPKSIRHRIILFRFKRPKLQGYRPKWTGIFGMFTKNYVRKEFWRFQHLNQEFEDIISEAYCIFLKCKKSYPIINTPQHFMALYKTALHNRFYDLAMESTYHKNVCYIEDIYHVDDSDERVHALDKEHSEPVGSDLGLLLRKAPQEIKDVLKVVFEAPAEMIDMFKKPRKQYSNVELGEKVGYTFDFRKKFNDYFIKGEL